jgi:hypothetical protein
MGLNDNGKNVIFLMLKKDIRKKVVLLFNVRFWYISYAANRFFKY